MGLSGWIRHALWHGNGLVDSGLIEETTDRSPRIDNERCRYYDLTPNGRLIAIDELTRLHTLVHRTAGHLPDPSPLPPGPRRE